MFFVVLTEANTFCGLVLCSELHSSPFHAQKAQGAPSVRVGLGRRSRLQESAGEEEEGQARQARQRTRSERRQWRGKDGLQGLGLLRKEVSAEDGLQRDHRSLPPSWLRLQRSVCFGNIFLVSQDEEVDIIIIIIITVLLQVSQSLGHFC